jgi:hypothetical protein
MKKGCCCVRIARLEHTAILKEQKICLCVRIVQVASIMTSLGQLLARHVKQESTQIRDGNSADHVQLENHAMVEHPQIVEREPITMGLVRLDVLHALLVHTIKTRDHQAHRIVLIVHREAIMINLVVLSVLLALVKQLARRGQPMWVTVLLALMEHCGMKQGVTSVLLGNVLRMARVKIASLERMAKARKRALFARHAL